jgi:predicted  nucleic acid-binding Zn-ribbon protein
MKNSMLIITTLVAFTLSCNSPERKVENAKQDLKEAKAELSQEQKDSVENFLNFKRESEERIFANEQTIQAYKDRMKTDKRKIKKADQKRIDELEQRNIDMRKKIEDYQANGKDNWEAFKQEFNHDMDDLGKALKNLTVKNTK